MRTPGTHLHARPPVRPPTRTLTRTRAHTHTRARAALFHYRYGKIQTTDTWDPSQPGTKVTRSAGIHVLAAAILAREGIIENAPHGPSRGMDDDAYADVMQQSAPWDQDKLDHLAGCVGGGGAGG